MLENISINYLPVHLSVNVKLISYVCSPLTRNTRKMFKTVSVEIVECRDQYQFQQVSFVQL